MVGAVKDGVRCVDSRKGVRRKGNYDRMDKIKLRLGHCVWIKLEGGLRFSSQVCCATSLVKDMDGRIRKEE